MASAATNRYPGWLDRLAVWVRAAGGNPDAPGGLTPHGSDAAALGQFAAAVSQAENGSGNPATISKPNHNGSVDVGLWQINSGHVGQTFTGPDGKPFTIESIAWLQDAANNAKAAYAISGGGHNWKPWCTAWSDNACGTKGGTYLGKGSSAVAKYVASGAAGDAASGTGLEGTLTLGASGPGSAGATGPQANVPEGVRTACDPGKDVWKIGPWTVLNQCQAQQLGGSMLIIAGAFVMLTGTVVILFRFQATHAAATAATAAIPGAGPVISTIAGKGSGPGPARRRSQKSAAATQQRRDEDRAAAPQRAYDIAKAREQGRIGGQRAAASSDDKKYPGRPVRLASGETF